MKINENWLVRLDAESGLIGNSFQSVGLAGLSGRVGSSRESSRVCYRVVGSWVDRASVFRRTCQRYVVVPRVPGNTAPNCTCFTTPQFARDCRPRRWPVTTRGATKFTLLHKQCPTNFFKTRFNKLSELRKWTLFEWELTHLVKCANAGPFDTFAEVYYAAS